MRAAGVERHPERRASRDGGRHQLRDDVTATASPAGTTAASASGLRRIGGQLAAPQGRRRGTGARIGRRPALLLLPAAAGVPVRARARAAVGHQEVQPAVAVEVAEGGREPRADGRPVPRLRTSQRCAAIARPEEGQHVARLGRHDEVGPAVAIHVAERRPRLAQAGLQTPAAARAPLRRAAIAGVLPRAHAAVRIADEEIGVAITVEVAERGCAARTGRHVPVGSSLPGRRGGGSRVAERHRGSGVRGDEGVGRAVAVEVGEGGHRMAAHVGKIRGGDAQPREARVARRVRADVSVGQTEIEDRGRSARDRDQEERDADHDPSSRDVAHRVRCGAHSARLVERLQSDEGRIAIRRRVTVDTRATSVLRMSRQRA